LTTTAGKNYSVSSQSTFARNNRCNVCKETAVNLDLADIGALLFVFMPLALLLVRIVVIPDGARLEDLIVPRMDFEWPRGVQEEEPVRWQVERLTPRVQRPPAQTPADESGPRRVRPRVAVRREPL
jgi:hypothetical protein